MIAASINILIIISRKFGSEFISFKSLETIYIAFIRPLLEYGDEIQDNCNQYGKNELDKIKNEAARITSGATNLVSLDNLYKEVAWETLHKRRQDHKITSFFIRCLIN